MPDSTGSAKDAVTEPLPEENTVAAIPGATDTAISRPPVSSGSSDNGNFKFIVESTTDKDRALNRYRKLKLFGNKIQIETADSVNFNLYFNLAATPADTLHLRDSLNRWYYGNAKYNRVVIAH